MLHACLLKLQSDAIAPDGSEVRLLATCAGGSMAHFRLRPGQVTRAVRHRSVEELWYVVAGNGRIWRRLGSEQSDDAVQAGTSVNIPAGTVFQFRCDGADPLDIVGVTMPPWPGPDEAVPAEGHWTPTIG